jgi:hypothetical protein
MATGHSWQAESEATGLPWPILQGLPAVCPARARIVHRESLMIQVFALQPPPHLIPLHGPPHSLHALLDVETGPPVDKEQVLGETSTSSAVYPHTVI